MEKHIFSTMEAEKRTFRNTVVISVIVALLVNSLVVGITGFITAECKNLVLAMTSSVLIVFLLINSYISKIKSYNKSIELQGFFICDKELKSIVEIAQYEISTDMHKYLRAFLKEDRAGDISWKTCSLFDSESINEKLMFGEDECARTLLAELIEYCIIDRLQEYLFSYYGNENFDNIIQHVTTDIPDVSNSNRFMLLLSKDIHQRESFCVYNDIESSDELEGEGELVYMESSDGFLFNRFNLLLPSDSSIKRQKKNVCIETKMYTVEIVVDFNGYSTYLPTSFLENYLGITDQDKYPIYIFSVNIKFSTKIRLFTRPKRTRYYAWVDGFFEIIDQYLSQDTFFEKINWKTVETLLKCQSTQQRK